MRRLLVVVGLVAGSLAVAPLTSAPVPKKLAGSGTIYVLRSGSPQVITLLTPDGDHIKEIKLGTKEACRVSSVSPGGKYAGVERLGRMLNNRPDSRWYVHLVDLERAAEELPEPIAEGWNPHVCWSSDGRTAYVSTDAEDPDALPATRQPRAEVFAYDTETGSGEKLGHARRHRILDVADRGRTFLTSEATRDERLGWGYTRWVLRGPDESHLTDAQDVSPTRFHPDGKRVFATRYPDRGGLEAVLLDPDGGKETVFGWPAKVKQLTGESPLQWELSPDGKRVVISWRREVENPAGWNKPGRCCVRCLGVCDLDGGRFKTIYTPEPKTMDDLQKSYIRGFEWR
jgi:hypothetical protein